MSETLVTLGRRSDGLVAVLSRLTQDESGIRCSLVQRPIEEAKPVVCPRAPSVAAAWEQLGRGRIDDPEVVASAVVVMLETVPLESVGRGGRLTPPSPPVIAHRTAAHPRGWVGFRAARARPTDLRSVLCRAGSWPLLRVALNAARTRAFPILCASGYEGDALELILVARDPYVAYHHSAAADAGLAQLPRGFRVSILPLLKSRPWGEVLRALSLHWALGQESDDAQLALAARLLAVSPTHGLDWLALLPMQPPERREPFVRLLLGSGAPKVDPTGLSMADVAAISHLEDWRYADRLTHLFGALSRGTPARHIFERFRIADAVTPAYRLATHCRCTEYEVPPTEPPQSGDLAARLRPLLLHIADAVKAAGTMAFRSTSGTSARSGRL